MSDYVSDLQALIVARLQADSFFSGLPDGTIVPEDKLDLLTDLAKSINATGLSLIVAATDGHPWEATGEAVQVTVTVRENVLLNRASTGSQKPARQCIMQAKGALQQNTSGGRWVPSDIWTPLQLIGWRYVGTEGEILVWEITLETHIGGLNYSPQP